MVSADEPVLAAASSRFLSAVNRPALERAKAILAKTCRRQALTTHQVPRRCDCGCDRARANITMTAFLAEHG